MKIKGIIPEDFSNYKRPSMFIITSQCSFKCDKEAGVRCCQNSDLAATPSKEIQDDDIIKAYLKNPITKAIVFGGLEPFDQIDELEAFIKCLRTTYSCPDIVVIYTGYNAEEISQDIDRIKSFENIVIKFGRYIPEGTKKFDEVLGVYLASDNQYAEVIS